MQLELERELSVYAFDLRSKQMLIEDLRRSIVEDQEEIKNILVDRQIASDYYGVQFLPYTFRVQVGRLFTFNASVNRDDFEKVRLCAVETFRVLQELRQISEKFIADIRALQKAKKDLKRLQQAARQLMDDCGDRPEQVSFFKKLRRFVERED